jgi:Ca2+-binding EF-hand superfamily protein
MNIKSIDDNIEPLRISLCSLPNFTPNKLFNYLDQSSKKFLLLNDFIKFLNAMGIPFEEKYLRIFIHNFDKDGDFSLNFNEFLGLILPKKNNDLARKMNQDIGNKSNIGDILINNMKEIFGKLLCEELELVKNCIKTAKACKETIGFTLYEAFLVIAGNNKYINETLLYNFLQKNNIDINANDMHELMFRLDADNDGKISFEEFKEIFFPIKGEEISYNIKNNNIIIDKNDYQYLEKEKENKDKIEDSKITNLVNFTFAKKTNIASKITFKKNEDYMKGFNKLINYNYEDDLIKNKENIQNTNNLTKDDQKISIYSRTKNLVENKNINLFKTKIPPKIMIPNKSSIPYLEAYTQIHPPTPKKYQFDYESNPLLIKKNANQNIATTPYSPKRINIHHTSGYQSPKTKHTKSPLHYDYSTYSDEDGDEYFRQKQLKDNKSSYTDKRMRNLNENKYTKIFGGFDYKNEIKNNLEKMFLEDESEANNKKFDISEINKEIKKRKFNFISNVNDNEENDIKMTNYDDLVRKKYKDDKYI